MSARLTIYRPSPTTVRFTVSNAPSRTTITARAIFYLGLILRVCTFFSVVFVNAAKARHYIKFLNKDVWLRTAPGVAVAKFADRQSWLLIAAASTIQDIIIHEAFRGFEVRFYLALIVEGESEVKVVFPK
ncbi:hypothetical protein KEM56_002993 [Ascosphaera pollenicola]|nr:hypothetical protein KEM56_002993 [Ascosphaera pollenicola]